MTKLSLCENKGTSWFWYKTVLCAALEVGEQDKKISVSVKKCSVLTEMDPRILALFRETLEHLAGVLFGLACPQLASKLLVLKQCQYVLPLSYLPIQKMLEEAALLWGVCDGDHERELEVVLGGIMEEHENCTGATASKRGEKGHQSTFI